MIYNSLGLLALFRNGRWGGGGRPPPPHSFILQNCVHGRQRFFCIKGFVVRQSKSEEKFIPAFLQVLSILS